MRSFAVLAVAALTLSACGKDEAAPSPPAKAGLTIKTDPATLPVPKGKLAVLPKETRTAAAAPPPARAVAPAPAEPVDPPAPPADVPPPLPERWAQASEPSPRDCRRAARRGDPLADSSLCQDVFAADEDERLIADCMDAQAEDHPFGWSPECRGALRWR